MWVDNASSRLEICEIAIYGGYMTNYIETSRLILRDWQGTDLLPFQQMNANREVRRYFPSLLSYRKSELDMQRMQENIEREGIGLFATMLKDSEEWIGFIGLNYTPVESSYPFDDLPFYEIGWRLMPHVWNRGLATEGATALLDYAAHHGIPEVYAMTAEKNLASRKVMTHIGMTLDEQFELPELSKYHPLKRQVRYYKVI